MAFNQSTDEDYYKPIWTKSAFNGNYIEYESKGDKNKNLSPKEYLDMIRPYLSDMITDYKTQGEWKIQLTLSINFFYSNGSDETRNLRSKSDNIEVMMGDETDEIIDEFYESFSQKYQKDLEESLRGSEFIFDSVNLLYYNLQITSLNWKGSSYIGSPEWLNNKRTTINPKNNDNNCFQYALTAALNYQNIKSHPERVSNLKPLADQNNWKEIDFPPHPSKDWEKFELNNKVIAPNILFVPYNNEKIRRAYPQKT